MQPNPGAEDEIARFTRFIDEFHALLLEENRRMRESAAPPDEALLEKKKALLPELDRRLARLKVLADEAAGGSPVSPDRRRAVKEARNRLLQILMLDRENERLLLKNSLPPKIRQAYAKVAPGQVARAYGQPPPGTQPPSPPA
ncbi:MAG: hypothetical protein EA425_14195 [Puniceicoccaceae bacterium]|nr:MAG: hypothetical protein EA425_14195 [Puniceicoccaceae bacterium]